MRAMHVRFKCCQLVLCTSIVGLSVITMLFIVFQNFNDEEERSWIPARFFRDESVYDKKLELALLIYVTTFISQSKSVLWHYLRRFLMKRKLCTPLTLGIIHVALSMTCISLFDFRIIHVQGTSKLMRSSILFADLTSLLLMESMESK